ncbi:MAG: SoxR reducing system RseC family protein [Candidatus Margulisbacteria bacterium]|nr:SoxR reducing system RseC family protein [Candidatus Margulisiibacteriota bacterium]
MVEFPSSSNCARCGACSAAASGKMALEADNGVGAQVGDSVLVGISGPSKVVFPFVVFGLPIVFLFIGYFIGNLISEQLAIILGVAALVLGFFALRMLDRKLIKSKRFKNRITKKI